MALYKYPALLNDSDHAEFDRDYTPGQQVPNSGIYKCQGCGGEIAANKPDPFPPQNHHQHTQQQGSIRWRLAVFAQ